MGFIIVFFLVLLSYFTGYFFSKNIFRIIRNIFPLRFSRTKNFIKSYLDGLSICFSILLAIILFYLLRSRVTNSDLIQVFIAYFTFLVLIFTVLIRDLANNYRDRPIIDINFNPNPPDCHLTTLTPGIPALYIRFRVMNTGKSTIKNAEVIVEKVYTNGNLVNNFLPLSLTWAATENQENRAIVSIPQGGFRTIDLAEIWETYRTGLWLNDIPTNNMQHQRIQEMASRGMRVCSVIQPNTLSDIIGYGTHIIYISILTDNVSPYFVKFKIKFDGQWTEQFNDTHLEIKLLEKGDSRKEVFD